MSSTNDSGFDPSESVFPLAVMKEGPNDGEVDFHGRRTRRRGGGSRRSSGPAWPELLEDADRLARESELSESTDGDHEEAKGRRVSGFEFDVESGWNLRGLVGLSVERRVVWDDELEGMRRSRELRNLKKLAERDLGRNGVGSKVVGTLLRSCRSELKERNRPGDPWLRDLSGDLAVLSSLLFLQLGGVDSSPSPLEIGRLV